METVRLVIVVLLEVVLSLIFVLRTYKTELQSLFVSIDDEKCEFFSQLTKRRGKISNWKEKKEPLRFSEDGHWLDSAYKYLDSTVDARLDNEICFSWFSFARTFLCKL